MNTLIVNKTEQTAIEQLFYFSGTLPPRHLRCINNRLVLENHKTLMGSALWTICKTEMRRSWPGSWFLPSVTWAPSTPRQPDPGGTAGSRKALGLGTLCFPAEQRGFTRQQERVTSPVPQHTRHNARDSKLPQRRGKAALFFPSLLPQPAHSQGRLKPWNNANRSMNRTKYRIRARKQRTNN